MATPLFVSATGAQINPIAAQMSRTAPQGRTPCLESKGNAMEKVIIPTVFGFAALMSLWAVVGAVV
ncbi:MAG: hypothetical protein AAFO86_03160 [Pseudomonadota bacterium]